MKQDATSQLWRPVTQCFAGAIGFAAVAFAGVRLGAGIEIASFLYLIVIALLSLTGSPMGSIVLAVAATVCLDYFFAAPTFSIWIANWHDQALIAVFLPTAIVVSTLVARSRRQMVEAADARQALQTALDEKHAVETSLLAAIVSSSDDAIIGKTLVGIVTSWNAAAGNIFGYQADEMIGRSITRIIPPELQKEEDEILRRIQRGERIKNYETVRVTKGGRRIDISLTVSPVLDQFGKVIGASKVARDITADKRAEAELQQTRDELTRVARVTSLGELTAAIAHEVNQPLAGVVSSGNACLRWLTNEPPDIAAARKSVERVICAGERAAEVIKRLRALVEKAPPQRERVSVNDAIAEVLALIPAEIQRKAIVLRTELANDAPLVLADRIQLQQVILNLVLNAIEAMDGTPQPRDLSVSSAKSEAGGVLVAVRDSGTGLDEKAMNRLFEAFYTTKAEGMGIGLAVSRTIIQTHGGRLWAEPNTPRGAMFAFSVPANGEQLS